MPVAVEFVGDESGVKTTVADAFNEGEVLVSALDLVGEASFKNEVAVSAHDNLGGAEALGEVGVLRACADEVAVVPGEEHVHVFAVADEMEINPLAAHGLSVAGVER